MYTVVCASSMEAGSHIYFPSNINDRFVTYLYTASNPLRGVFLELYIPFLFPSWQKILKIKERLKMRERER